MKSNYQLKMFGGLITGVVVGFAASSVFLAGNALAEHPERKVLMVQKEISAGQQVEVDLKDDLVRRVDVVVRRTQGGTETQLNAGLENSAAFGGPQQVDKNENHVLSYQGADMKSKDRDLILSAINGNVFVESVHVFYGDD